MATIITNQATLDYRYGTVRSSVISNVTTAFVGSSLSVNKTSLSQTYREGQNISYIISITNSGSTVNDFTVFDNLGSFYIGSESITPLSFINADLFIDGVLVGDITPVISEDGIAFTVSELGGGSNAQIIYEAKVNCFANLECGSAITNVVSLDCNCPCDTPVSASHTIFADCYADLRIVKSVCPNPIICGNEINYVFDIFNYGNEPADDVVLNDTFTPPLSDITVTLNGSIVPSDDYFYENGIFKLPAENSGTPLSVPAASFIRDDDGCLVINPAKIQVTVSGRI